MARFMRHLDWGVKDMVSHRFSAQGSVEYGLIIALVAVIAIAGLLIFGPAVSSLLSSLSGSV
jgi:thiosulfate reductase cytochrome b subunit